MAYTASPFPARKAAVDASKGAYADCALNRGDVESLPAGTAVEYFSQSSGGWIAAVVHSFDSRNNTYKLDVHPSAPVHKVRAAGCNANLPSGEKQCRQSRNQYQPGTSVEYYSTSRGGWIPAVVVGFDDNTGAYKLDIQPVALPDKVRLASNHAAVASPAPQHSLSHPQQQDYVGMDYRRASMTPDPASQKQGNAASAASGRHRSCGICKASYAVDALQAPACEHLFCTPCLRRYVLGKDFVRQTITCPCCNTKLSSEHVQQVVGDAAFKARQDQMNREDEELARQLAQGKKLMCPKCGKDHDGTTCEKYREWEQENRNADKNFEKLMVQMQWRRCPKCKQPSERASGCNFMQCRSTVCQKRTYWCYICGLQMRLEDHYSHYPVSPYEDDCFTPEAQRLPLQGQDRRAPQNIPADAVAHYHQHQHQHQHQHRAAPNIQAHPNIQAQPAQRAPQGGGAAPDDENCVCQ